MGTPYWLGGTKRRNSNSNSVFLGSKIGIRFDTKWHHMAPNKLLNRRISIIFRRASFWIFQEKWDLGFLGQKRRIGDELQVLKTRKMILVVFLTFHRCVTKKLVAHRCVWFFPMPPNLPKPSKHATTIGKSVFWPERSTWEFRLFVPPGQYLVMKGRSQLI